MRLEAEETCLRGPRGLTWGPKRIGEELTAIHVGTVLGQTCDWGRWYRGGVLLVPTYSQFWATGFNNCLRENVRFFGRVHFRTRRTAFRLKGRRSHRSAGKWEWKSIS